MSNGTIPRIQHILYITAIASIRHEYSPLPIHRYVECARHVSVDVHFKRFCVGCTYLY